MLGTSCGIFLIVVEITGGVKLNDFFIKMFTIETSIFNFFHKIIIQRRHKKRRFEAELDSRIFFFNRGMKISEPFFHKMKVKHN